jgi:DNA-binding SARP family transcriptional activator
MCSSDLDLAGKYLVRMSGITSKSSKYDKSHYHFLLGWDAILRDDCHMARSHMEKALQLKKEIGSIFGIVSNGLCLADVLHSLGENDAALDQLDQSRKIAEQTGSHFLIYHSGILEAQFLLDNGEDERATDVLVRVLAVGAAKSIFNFHWFRADVMSRLLAFAINREIEVKYCLDFIRKHNLIPDDQSVDVKAWPWPVKIYTLGRFELLVRDEKVRFSRKAQEKPIDLLKAILAFGGRKVASESLVEALWPDSDGAAGQQALATTLHRLRQLIDVKDTVIFSQGQITLNPELCWVDIWAVERAMGRVNPHLEKGNQAGKECEEKSQQIEGALELYKGHFMSSDGNEPWSIGPRERLRSKFIRTLRNYCAHLEMRGEDERAIQWYLKALELENLAEELYQGLIHCYLRLGRKADAMATYNRCKETLSLVLGVEPSPATEELRRQILEEEPLDAGTR